MCQFSSWTVSILSLSFSPVKSQLPSIDEELQDSVTLDRQRGISRRGNSTLIKHNTINSISSITSEEDASEVASIGESITSERFEDSILDDQFGDDISYNELVSTVICMSHEQYMSIWALIVYMFVVTRQPR